MELTIHEGLRVEIVSGALRGERGTVKRMNAARTYCYIDVPRWFGSSIVGRRIIRVSVNGVERDQFMFA